LATGSGDSSVRLWDAQAGREFAMLRHDAEIRALVFSGDGEMLLVASGSPSSTRNDMAVRLWRVRDRRVVRSFPFQGAARGAAATAVAFSPEGEQVFAAPATEPVVYVWDRRTGNVRAMLTGHSAVVNSIAFSPDRSRIVTGSADKTVRLWHSRTFQQLLLLRGHLRPVHTAMFTPDGARILSSSGDIRIWGTGGHVRWPRRGGPVE